MVRSYKNENGKKKTQILADYKSNGDWLSKSQQTAYRWVSQGEKEASRGGQRFRKVSNQCKDFMWNKIEENPK